MARRSRLVLTILALLVGFSFQGTRGLYDPTEGRYAEVAREMRASGNYLEPTLSGRPHWTKPPLTYWAIAGGLAVAGNNTWGVRAYNAVAFTLTTLAVAATAATLWNPTTGLIAGVVYLSSPYTVMGANVASADTLLAMFAALALLAYVRAWRGGGAGWTRMMWLMFGLAFFTKGPPALLPLLAILVFHVIARKPFRLFDFLGLSLAVASGLWWYLLMIARHHELFGYFVGKEIVARNTSGAFHRNGHWYGPFVVYLPVLLLGAGLWTMDTWRALRLWHVLSPAGLRRAFSVRNSTIVLLLLWSMLPLAFFVLSRSRLPLYLLPLYPAVAITAAYGVRIADDSRQLRSRVLWRAVPSIVLLIALKGAMAYKHSDQDAARLYRDVETVAKPGTTLALFDESACYGFQFYAGRDLKRYSSSGEEPWADGTLGDMMNAQESDPAIITTTRGAATIEKELSAGGVAFEERRVAGKELILVPTTR